MGYGIDALSYLAGLVCKDEPVLVNPRPLRSYAMQIPPLGKEFNVLHDISCSGFIYSWKFLIGPFRRG